MTGRRTGVIGTLVILLIALELVAYAGILGSAQNAAALSNGSSVSPAASTTQTPLNLNLTLTGAGASFPAPLILNWTQEYHKLGHGNVTITYSAVGSGKGQAAAINQTVDFAASDAPLSTRQRALYPNILHIPETIGSVTLSYNLPLVNQTVLPKGVLNMTGTVVANIFLGSITNWNDSAIRALNPGLARVNQLPNQSILTAHRKDSSGTTFVFTSYLCEESLSWCSTVGNGTLVNWPNGVASSLNSGVASYVNSTKYSFGYVELQYVVHGNLTYAKLLNNDGTNYVLPSLQTTSNAVTAYTSTHGFPAASGDWSQVRMLNQPGLNTYPIASLTYLLVYREQNINPDMDLKDKVQFHALVDFLNWAVTTGQNFAPDLTYVQLTAGLVAIDQAGINSMTYTEISTPASRTVNMSIGASGFNASSITVATGDTVTLRLNNLDGAHHEWYIDFNNNGIQDSNETFLTCPSTGLGVATCTLTPTVLNTRSVPAVGTYTFRDNSTAASGSITILPQQVAAVFHSPATDVNSKALPTLDNSRVATVGSLLIDMRTHLASQNVTVVAADKTTAAITYSHTYSVPNLQLGTVSGVTGLGLRFVLNVQVGPYALSTNILVQLQGQTATTSTSLTRELDMNNRGVVDITDVGTVLSAYGTTIGNPGYNPLADLNGSGTINILGLGPLFANYGFIVLYT